MEYNKVHNDIIIAQKILSNSFSFSTSCVFDDSSKIYRGTNELVSSEPYVKAISNREKILSVIGSGDQIINSCLYGSKDITGIDISRFPKYYLMLKLAALKKLSREEYLDFFIGTINDTLLNDDVYDDLRTELDENTKMFWDSIFDYFDSCEINNSRLFATDIMNKSIMTKNNPYLQEENYKITKEKIRNINIRFFEGNLFTFFNNFQEDKKYNLINLSNIIQYPIKSYGKTPKQIYTNYKKFIESLPLEKDGISLSYFFNLNKQLLTPIFEENYYMTNFKDTTSGILVYKRG